MKTTSPTCKHGASPQCFSICLFAHLFIAGHVGICMNSRRAERVVANAAPEPPHAHVLPLGSTCSWGQTCSRGRTCPRGHPDPPLGDTSITDHHRLGPGGSMNHTQLHLGEALLEE